MFAKCIHFLGSTVIKYGNLFSLSASESAAGYKKIYYASETFTHLSGKHHAEWEMDWYLGLRAAATATAATMRIKKPRV
jgi:hypothetical protein